MIIHQRIKTISLGTNLFCKILGDSIFNFFTLEQEAFKTTSTKK